MRPDRRKTPLRDLTTYGRGRAVRRPDCGYSRDVDLHITICSDRAGLFPSGRSPASDVRGRLANEVCHNVEFYCTKLRYRLYGYTLMPDHLHVLFNQADSGNDLGKWLDSFKSFTTHQFMQLSGKAPLWQGSANDHILRDGETAEAVLRYIVVNPVRAGFVERWQDWPWTKVFIEI